MECQHQERSVAIPDQRIRSSYRDLALTLPFIALFLVQLAHHNMWRDELNAFGIAVASPTLRSLFYLIHYEGHPWLWYVMLWGVSKFTVFPWGMKVLEGAIGVGIYLMLGLASPFSRWEKVLIFLGYFITFEYTVMVRMYGILLLLALVYIRQRTLHPERALTLGLLLGLMASTDALGVILSMSLLAEYSYDQLKGSRRPAHPSKRLLWTGLAYVVLLAVSLYSVRLAPDISWRTNPAPLTSASDPAHLLQAAYGYIVEPYFLAENRPLRYFWILPPPRTLLFSCGIPLVLLVYWTVFRARRNLLLLMGVTIVGSILFGHLVYLGAQRQFGMTFLAFLMGLWILRAACTRLPAAAYLLLGLTALSGILANFGEWAQPFSNAEPAAHWLQANHLADAPITGAPDTTVASIAELLHRPVYMLDCNCSDTFLWFSKRRDQFSPQQIPARLALARKNLNVSSFLFVESHPMLTTEAAGIAAENMSVTQLMRFTGAEASGENFYIYRIAIAPNPASVQP